MNPLEDEFDPHAPANLAGAAIAVAQAQATALGFKNKIAEPKGSDLDWLDEPKQGETHPSPRG